MPRERVHRLEIEPGRALELEVVDENGAPIADAVGDLRTVDPKGSAILAARAMGICFGDTPGYVNPFGSQDDGP